MNTSMSDYSESGDSDSRDEANFIAYALFSIIVFLLMICLFCVIKMYCCDKVPFNVPIHPIQQVSGLESDLESDF